ncbi:ABC transporter, permease protein [Lachnospiraceae bacterium KM106-2]|nr:ABC transporter, permease protein [Lachnospiraceae bacterium KM106-2]
MKNLWLITKEDFKNLITNPMWVFYAIGFPILLVIILGFLTKDNYSKNFSSFDFYGITLMIYAVINSGMTSANAFMEERIKKPNMRIIYAPGSAKNIYLSKVIASTLFSLLFHTLDMIFLCFVFAVHVTHIPEMFLLFALLELCFNTLGVMMCCIFKAETTTNQLQSIVVNLMGIFGGLLFSLDGYGAAIRHISMISPVKWIADASFQIMYDQNNTLFLPCVAGLIGSILIMLLVCAKTFRKEDCIC